MALVGAIGAAALVPFGASVAEAGPVRSDRSAHAARTTGTKPAGRLAAPGQPGCSSTGVGSPSNPAGYWMAGADGSVYSCGDAAWYGSLTSQHITPSGSVVGIASCGAGYWLVTSAGAVYTFGQEFFFGGANAQHLNAPIVGITATEDCYGYWLVAADGEVFTYGDADALGSPATTRLTQPMVGMAVPPEPLLVCRGAKLYCDSGYWLVAADGGVFAYNSPSNGSLGYNGSSANFLGSTGCLTLNQPVVGMAVFRDAIDVGANTACHTGPEPPGGYWMVASDGGVFAFGDAPFLGSTGCIRLNSPVVGMVDSTDPTTVGANSACLPGATAAGGSAALQPGGYLMVAADGGVFSFGNVSFAGSLPGSGISVNDIVGIAL